MDPTSALTTALAAAGPFGLISAVLLFLYVRSDKRNQELTDKVIDMGTTMSNSLKDIKTAVDAALNARNQK